MAGEAMVVGFLSVPALFGIAVGGFMLFVFFQLWRGQDRRPDAHLGPIVFSTKVHPKIRSTPGGPYSAFTNPSGGLFDLSVHENVVRLHSGTWSWLRPFFGGDVTFDAASCEVDRAKISQVWSLPDRGDEYVVLRGVTTRGWVELGVRPKAASPDELEQALLGAGFHRAEESSAA